MKLAGKNVLVLGGAGFIGSALVRGLVKEKAETIVYDNFSFGRPFNLKEIKDHIKIINGDVLDSKNLLSSIRKNDIEMIFHLVANPFIPNSYKHPEKVFHLITQSTQNVLKASNEVGIKKFMYISSAEIYGKHQYLPMDENHPLNPLSIYAIAKLAAEKLCMINSKRDFSLFVLRLFNSFGPRETHPYIIPDLISQFSRSSVVKLGNLESRRSFVYVDDAAEGIIEMMKRGNGDEIMNLGSDKSYSVRELAEIVGKKFGHKKIKIIVDSKRKRPLDPKVLECDFSKAKKIIGWKPRVSFNEGLDRTIKWFLENGRSWVWEKNYG